MKKWICIGLFLIGTCSVQAQDLVSDFLANRKQTGIFRKYGRCFRSESLNMRN